MTNSILFVCTGNICRSPSAMGAFRHYFPNITFDSAATHMYHVGENPDLRSIHAAKNRGFDISAHIARKVNKSDFEKFDLIYAMDRTHMEYLNRMCPPEHKHKLKLLLEDLGHPYTNEVPDPYHGNATGFEHVMDLIEWAAKAMASRL